MACRQLQSVHAPGLSRREAGYSGSRCLPWLVAGWASLLLYLCWNAAWLAQGRLAPSLLVGIFGIPAPTTGLTRSLGELLQGNFDAALLWNPFTIPICLLFIATICWALSIALRRRRSLPAPIVRIWLTLLAAAWIAKFIIGPEYW